MPKKKVVDAAKLISAVNSGMTDKEMMERFAIKSRTQLKSLYLDALVANGSVVSIVGRNGGGNVADDGEVELKVNKRGSLVVPKPLVQELGYQLGDAFKARRTKAGIALKKI